MKDFLAYLIENIVIHPDQVVIEEHVETVNQNQTSDDYITKEGDSRELLVFSVKVADEDAGIVIGKNGQTINALRRLLRLKNMNSGKYQSVRLDLSID